MPQGTHSKALHGREKKVSVDICSIQEKRLVDRLQSLKIKGEVIGKKTIESFGDRPERKVVVIRFKDRTIEKETDESEFGRTEIGGESWFIPPVPERDLCNCHLCVWLIVAVMACALTIWAITNHFHGRTAILLSLVATGWISLIAWVRICSHERSKYLRDLQMEIEFFETDSDREQGDRK